MWDWFQTHKIGPNSIGLVTCTPERWHWMVQIKPIPKREKIPIKLNETIPYNQIASFLSPVSVAIVIIQSISSNPFYHGKNKNVKTHTHTHNANEFLAKICHRNSITIPISLLVEQKLVQCVYLLFVELSSCIFINDLGAIFLFGLINKVM